MSFKDHFSDRSADYATFRPIYPDSLIDTIAQLPGRRRLALDCGTGNGQAAVSLARHFDRVIATDRSLEQLQHAKPNPKVDYRRAAAEASGLPDRSVDLVTAAQSLHWFDIEAFFREARRVLVANGAIAVWGYGDPILDEPALQATLHELNRGILEPYWLPERALLLAGYATIEFPFEEIRMPPFTLEVSWSLAQLTGLLRTWSAAARYVAEHRRDPVAGVERALSRDWGNPDGRRVVRWPVYLRAGRVAGTADG
ncbi:MAG: class I SAM-dependent methyltransferase [Gemmatimonadaceae bacterium]